MEQPQNLPQRTTPARRRAKRPVNSPARKNYASENDVPSDVGFPIDIGGPFTPQKSASNSPAPGSQAKSQAKSRPRNVNGAGNGHGNGNANGNRRGKQVASPAPAKQGRTTPPHTAPKPIAEVAFAGATFHASPAPSSLPIPSFLSKTLDSPPSVQRPNDVNREPSPPATDSEAVPTPQHRLISPAANRTESPLDIFFRADRAEKERARRASSANVLGTVSAPFSPPSQVRSPVEPKTVPNGVPSAGSRRPGFQRGNASGGIPASELDGTPSEFIGPALSKPYQERIREALSAKKQSDDGALQQPPNPVPQESAMDMTERLKRFLAIPPVNNEPSSTQSSQQPSSKPPPLFSQPPARSTDLASPFASPGFAPNHAMQPPFSPGFPPQQRCASDIPAQFRPANIPPSIALHGGAPPSAAPSYPPNGSGYNDPAADIMRMEDSLRRILKLSNGPAVAAPNGYQSS
ncbi:hypothetical protein VTJ83DRAFT_1078 [Remersonia thermophila]|uniref:Proteophosphoglycan 5 n=1 Tax=Remersonia thermophila TaxID=72144 RepID=A0ABR4DNA7_9PEZI